MYASSARRCSGEAWAAVDARRRRCASCGGLDLEGEDDDLALGGALDAGLAVGLEAREGRERHLLLPRVLPRTRPRHVGVRVGPRAPGRRVLLEFVGWWVQARRCARVLGGGGGGGEEGRRPLTRAQSIAPTALPVKSSGLAPRHEGDARGWVRAGGGGHTIDSQETSPPVWIRPTRISTTVPLPLAYKRAASLSVVVDMKARSTPPRHAGFPCATQNCRGSSILPERLHISLLPITSCKMHT